MDWNTVDVLLGWFGFVSLLAGVDDFDIRTSYDVSLLLLDINYDDVKFRLSYR